MIFKYFIPLLLFSFLASAELETSSEVQLTSKSLDNKNYFQGGFFKFQAIQSFNEKRDDFGLLEQPADKIIFHSRLEANSERDRKEIVFIGQKNGVQKQFNKNSSLFIGENILIWGKADEINPTDVWNAEDLEYFFTREKSLRKIPRTMMIYEWLEENKKIQLVLAPFEQRMQSLFPKRNSGWCNIGCQATSKTLNQEVYADFGYDTDFEKVENFNGFDTGLRFSNSTNGIDYSLSLYNGTTRLPVFKRDLQSTTAKFTPYTNIFNSYGLDLSYALFGFTFIFESQYTTDSPFYIDSTSSKFLTDTDGLILKDEVKNIIGISRMFTYDIFFNLQYMKANILGDDSDVFYFGGRELLSLQTSKVFWDDFKFEITYLVERSVKNFSENYELNYKHNDHYSLDIGAYLITSHDDETLFTGLENSESYYLNLNASF